jgi:hypothetical protein
MTPPGHRVLSQWLSRAPAWAFSAYATFAAFAVYFCMYAFRKPFAVGTYAGSFDLGIAVLDRKTVFVIAQVVGYAASKFLGIKIISEMPAQRRALALVACIAVAELALVLFAVAPPQLAVICLVANGLPLGMVWGLVFGFLEGRKVSDLLGAGLCASFIVASGFVKTAGKWLLDSGVSEPWMPAATGALFLLPLIGFTYLLAALPPPTRDDEAERVKRAPMDAAARRAFFWRFAAGLVPLVAAYVALTALRDVRDNFAREIWDALGFGKEPAIMTTAEIPVAFVSLVAVAAMMGIRNSRMALLALHGMMLAGAALIAGSTLLFRAGALSPAMWMISVGIGLYVGYVPFNCVLFDRLVAAVGQVATAGFLIYVADAMGYIGSVALLLYRSLGSARLSWVDFFQRMSLVTAAVCAVLFVVSARYFARATTARHRS